MNVLRGSLRFLPITYAEPEALRKKENDQPPLNGKPSLGGLHLSSSPGVKGVWHCLQEFVYKTALQIHTSGLKGKASLKLVQMVRISWRQMLMQHPAFRKQQETRRVRGNRYKLARNY